MSDYSKKSEVPRTFIEIADDLNDLVTELNDKIVETIRNKPADMEPVRHARWEELPQEGRGPIPWYEAYECSQCQLQGFRAWRYCPHCGAKMDVKISRGVK